MLAKPRSMVARLFGAQHWPSGAMPVWKRALVGAMSSSPIYRSAGGNAPERWAMRARPARSAASSTSSENRLGMVLHLL